MTGGSAAIESGWVQVNQGGGQAPGHSCGGYKQSGIGRELSLEGYARQLHPAQERDRQPQHAAPRVGFADAPTSCPIKGPRRRHHWRCQS